MLFTSHPFVVWSLIFQTITSNHEEKSCFLFHATMVGGELGLSAVIFLDHTAHPLREERFLL